MVWIALAAAIVAILGQHLGLAEEMANIAAKVAKCPKCCTFWVVISALLYNGCDIITASALSMIMAYLSFWIGFILIVLQRLYDIVWKKLNKRK